MADSSTPLSRLEARMIDAERLVEIHEECTGAGSGRRRGYDALNRSAVVLAVAAWEGFVEDVAASNARLIAGRLRSAQDLPENVRDGLLFWMHNEYKLATLNRGSKDALWRLTDDRWRTEYMRFAIARLKRFHTPNHDNVRKLFAELFGIADVSAAWGYRRWPHTVYAAKLNQLLSLRHEIAHGSIGEEAVRKSRARNSIQLVTALATRTQGAVLNHRRSLDLKKTRFRIRHLPRLENI